MAHPEIKEPSAGHPITIEPTKGRVQVRVNGELVADTTDDGQGLVKVAFREVKDGTLREGTVVTRPNGTERHLYTERAATWTGDWDYDVDATGTGSGTLVVHPSQGADVTCTVVVTDGTCRFTCPGDGPARC